MGNEPTYKIAVFENDGIIEVTITGEVADHDVDKMENDVQAVLKPMNPKKLLADVRSLKIQRSIVDTYNRVRNYPPLMRIKTAVLDIPDHADFQKFHETTANNAGIPMKFFMDIDEARAWLKSRSKI
jgi:hypothetical protein